jgi:hypothetical protein
VGFSRRQPERQVDEITAILVLPRQEECPGFPAAEAGQISAEKEMDLPHARDVQQQDFIAGGGISTLAAEAISLPASEKSNDR